MVHIPENLNCKSFKTYLQNVKEIERQSEWEWEVEKKTAVFVPYLRVFTIEFKLVSFQRSEYLKNFCNDHRKKDI